MNSKMLNYFLCDFHYKKYDKVLLVWESCLYLLRSLGLHNFYIKSLWRFLCLFLKKATCFLNFLDPPLVCLFSCTPQFPYSLGTIYSDEVIVSCSTKINILHIVVLQCIFCIHSQNLCKMIWNFFVVNVYE